MTIDVHIFKRQTLLETGAWLYQRESLYNTDMIIHDIANKVRVGNSNRDKEAGVNIQCFVSGFKSGDSYMLLQNSTFIMNVCAGGDFG